jgi:AraC-like DNA-binding protein/quercetin dioxygenase-like cupin family protein
MSNFRQAVSRQDDSVAVRSLSLRFRSGSRIEQHEHEWAQLIYATQGTLAVETAPTHWLLPPHRCLWVPAGVEHSVESVGETAMRTLYVRPDLAPAIAGVICVKDVSPLLRELIQEAARLEMLDEAIPYHAACLCLLLGQIVEARALQLALPLPRDSRAHRVVKRALRSLHAKEPLSELVRGTGASARTIERLFQAETGLSFGRWRQQARLHHAVRRLSEGCDVTNVALDCGYESVSAFVVMFKRSLGTTPGRYFQRRSFAAGFHFLGPRDAESY